MVIKLGAVVNKAAPPLPEPTVTLMDTNDPVESSTLTTAEPAATPVSVNVGVVPTKLTTDVTTPALLLLVT
jgi:hypothetical protein